jgi:hypothetical protein
MLYFVDGEVSLGIFGTTSKEAILSQLKPVTKSGGLGQKNNPREIHA